MKNLEIYKGILDEFNDVETALNSTLLISANCVLVPTDEEIETLGSYASRLNVVWDEILWEVPSSKRELCKQIANAHYDYDLSRYMSGLGGCTPKSYKEIINKQCNPDGIDYE